MMERFKMNLLQGKYQEAEEVCENMDLNSIRDLIMSEAYATESISVYGFVQYMIRKTGKENWMELAIDIMLNPLCFIEGAYSVALFHARELLLMERNVVNLERILFFYNIPEKLVHKEEAWHIAKEILEMEPDNEVAIKIYTELLYPSRETITKLTKDLELKGATRYTQDWECEVADVDQLPEYIAYYKQKQLTLNEKTTLMRIILESYNDYIGMDHKEDRYGEGIKEILKNDYFIHEETIKFWSCENEDLEDCYAITPFIRTILKWKNLPIIFKT